MSRAAEPGHALFETALGPIGIAWSARGLVAVQLPERSARATEHKLAARTGTRAAEPPAFARKAMAALEAHLGGRPQDLSRLPLDLESLPRFRRRIYEALRAVAPGRTLSYGELARAAGSPSAARAVGAAMGANPLPLVVPCHRVLAANGRPGGFTAFGGVATKERLLALEGVHLANGRDGLPFSARDAVRHLREVDARLAAVIERAGPFRLEPRFQDPFEYLLRAIVYQQLAGRAARTIHERVLALFAPKKRVRPRDVLAADPERLRGAGLSRSKLASLLDLAERAAQGELPTLARMRRMDDESVVESLVHVRGIGRWSAQMLLIFNLGRADVLPVGDYGVRKGFAVMMRKRELPSESDLERRGERWRPYRTVASWYMWRAVDLDRPVPSQVAPA